MVKQQFWFEVIHILVTHYKTYPLAVQGHLRSLILAPTESKYATSY